MASGTGVIYYGPQIMRGTSKAITIDISDVLNIMKCLVVVLYSEIRIAGGLFQVSIVLAREMLC